MIITVDPSQSEDIAAFAMVKQYRMQALNVTLNGGTGSSAWQAVQGGEGYTQTVVTPVTGIELVYDDPNAIVSYTVENNDTSNYDVASDAGIILSSIEPTDNAWTYTCVFHADSVPVSSVNIDLLVYGNTARGTEQQGSPATAEEITAQVLAGLETRVTALEEEMPDKVDKLISSPAGTYKSVTVNAQGQVTAGTNPTTLAGYGITDAYTKTEADTLLGAKANDNAVVKLTGNQTITGIKTLAVAGSDVLFLQAQSSVLDQSTTGAEGRMRFRWSDKNGTGPDNRIVEISTYRRANGNNSLYLTQFNKVNNALTSDGLAITLETDGTAHMEGPSRAYSPGNTRDIVTLGLLDAYTPMVRTTGNVTFSGIKKAGGGGFYRKQSATLNLTTPPAGTITDENYVMEDKNGTAAVQMFNSYTANAQTIFQIATKYPFTEGDGTKITNAMLWLTAYADKAVLFLRFVDKNGSAHLKTLGTVTEND